MMKKIIVVLFLFILLNPVVVFAKEGTKKMYIKMTIEENGSVKVEELAELSGKYNGRLRDIAYRNENAKLFTGSYEGFKGSSIYNGSGISDVKVCETASYNISEDDFGKCAREYKTVSYANNGTSGVYQRTDTKNGVNLKIYNPSSTHKSFYLSYTILDAVVMHNDVAELAWNILGDAYTENIEELKVWVSLPKADNDLRVWLKGGKNTLNGKIENIKNKTAYIYFDFLGAYNPITVRMMFNKSITPLSTKLSGVNGKDNILKVEEEAATEANKVRDRIKRQNYLVMTLTVIWYLSAVIILILFIRAKKKNGKSSFEQDYLRDLPAEYGPEILEYLMKNHVSDLGMSASLLNIIDKKVLAVSENPDENKDYYLTLEDKEMNGLTPNEKRLCKLFIEQIGNGEKVSLSEIKNYGNDAKKASILLREYNIWKTNANMEGKEEGFFTGLQPIQNASLIIGVLSIGIIVLNISFETNFIPGFLVVIFGVFLCLYILSYSFKTEKGALDYSKWLAFKRFLKDFGLLHEKELPEIKLRGKYLTYATVLGCADEVEKAMKIHMDAMNIDESSAFYWDYYYTNHLMRAHIYSSISSSIASSVSASRSSIASSSSASGDGFGGGSSFGGGSFGGGGGGGRF